MHKKICPILALGIGILAASCSSTPTAKVQEAYKPKGFSVQSLSPYDCYIRTGQTQTFSGTPSSTLYLRKVRLLWQQWWFNTNYRYPAFRVYINGVAITPSSAPLLNKSNASIQYGGSWDPQMYAWAVFYDGKSSNTNDYDFAWDISRIVASYPPGNINIQFTYGGDGNGSILGIGDPPPAPTPTPTPTPIPTPTPEPTINPAYNRIESPYLESASTSTTTNTTNYRIDTMRYPSSETTFSGPSIQ